MSSTLRLAVAAAALLATAPSSQVVQGEREPLVSAEVLHMRSEVLGQERTVRVSLPASYAATARAYPTVYLLDGESYGFLLTVTATRFLAAMGAAPEVVVVGVHNVSRESDMTPEGLRVPQFEALDRRADDFLEHFAEELVPYLEERYRLAPLRVLVGHSHGGIFGTYALAARPDVFPWHLAIDAPLYLDDSWLLRELATSLDGNARAERLVAVEAGAHVGTAWAVLEACAAGSFLVQRLVVEGESHESVLYRGVHEGLRELFHDYALEEQDPRTLTELREASARLTSSYGYAPAPSRRALVLQAENQLLLGFGHQARLLLEEAMTSYGRSPFLEELHARALRVEAAGEPQETVADVLATPRATPEEIAPYLGEWELVSSGDPRNLLRLSVEDGHVVGSFLLADPSGRRTGPGLEVDVIEVLDDGRLAFGYVNNRRPKGVLYYTLARDERGHLVGSMTFRGVTMDGRIAEYLEGRVFDFRPLAD